MVDTVKMSSCPAIDPKVCHRQQRYKQPGEEPVWLWHHEVSDDSQQRKQMFRAIVSKVLVMRGLSVAHW